MFIFFSRLDSHGSRSGFDFVFFGHFFSFRVPLLSGRDDERKEVWMGK